MEKSVCLPGFCDVHVHFREPGFCYKETIESGSRAAARGGYTTVCTMPNLKPVPHSAEEKGKGLAGSAFGVVGIETAFPLLYTYLVKKGVITMERLLQLLVYVPRERFGIPVIDEDCSYWDLNKEYVIDPEDFLSKGKATPFEGWKVFGECVKTVCKGKVVYERQ